MRSFFSTAVSTACLLFNVVNAALTRDDIIIDQGDSNYLWDSKFSISEDLTATWEFSTKSSERSSFVTLGPETADNSVKQGYTGSITFHKQHNVSELAFSDWKVEGIYSLSAGIRATATFTAQGAGVADTPDQNILNVTGPTSGVQTFSASPKIGSAGACSGLDEQGRRTFRLSSNFLKMSWALERLADASANAKGVIGGKSDNALRVTAKLSGKDGCSKTNLNCEKDRTGFELCFGN